jgi:DGQHR domain-containing protein
MLVATLVPSRSPAILTNPKVAWVVDGQQRTLALSKAKNKSLLVPVTAFVSDDFEVHRTQFLLVNKVRPLPKGLINELLPAINVALPPSLSKNRIPSYLCDLLNKDPDSPFYKIITRHTTDQRENRSAVDCG